MIDGGITMLCDDVHILGLIAVILILRVLLYVDPIQDLCVSEQHKIRVNQSNESRLKV